MKIEEFEKPRIKARFVDGVGMDSRNDVYEEYLVSALIVFVIQSRYLRSRTPSNSIKVQRLVHIWYLQYRI